jgi:hypothetical protein
MHDSFTYIDSTHQYFIDGVEVPSVTTVLKSAGIIDDRFYTEAGRERGTAVHLACQLLDEDDLDWDSVTEEISGYVKAYQAFKKDSGFKPLKIEEAVYSRSYQYAGRFDRLGEIDGNLVLMDIKTGSIPKWVELQLAGYETALLSMKSAEEINKNPVLLLQALQLRENGSYKLKQASSMSLAERQEVFLSAVRLYHWKKNNGVKV